MVVCHYNYIHKYQEQITIDRVHKWFCKLIEALSLLQKNKIIHLDLKSSNIVMMKLMILE